MAIQLIVRERRDMGNREAMATTALDLCRVFRKDKGITSARFFWSGTEIIVFWIDGETTALDTLGNAAPADFGRLFFTMEDNARRILNIRLMDLRTATDATRTAGR